MALVRLQCGLIQAVAWPYYVLTKARALIGSDYGSIEASQWPY